MLKRRPCRLQTADCADWVLFYLLLMNYLVLELHKQEPWYSNKIVGFKPLPLIGVNAWSKYNCRSPSENPPRRTLLGIEKKKKKTYTKVLPESSELYVNNDDIGICKIWRNDSKSPVWITEWKQRRSSTMKEIEEMSLVAVVGGRKGFYFKPPNLKKLLLPKKMK